MANMKIGVLADTHVPDLLPALPPRVLETLRGVDIILHVGDICDLGVLQQLEPIAQTYAVYGDRDSAQVRQFLQEKQRLQFANRAVGLVHGHHAWEGGLGVRLRFQLDRARRLQTLCASVLREFTDVDAIVFGHSHAPYIKMHGGVLLFNPGSVVPRDGRSGSIGFLEISSNAIKGRIVTI
ncbi:MAG: metallophosphoesterase family protein [Chloroflexota bacterium]|nr:metallophosphoesterase family protein [Chloroflexota bacterium]